MALDSSPQNLRICNRLQPFLATLTVCIAMTISCHARGEEVAVSGTNSNKEERVRFFETSVRPILVDHCYECHGADDGSRGGEFRLDTSSGLRHGGSQGPAIIVGKSDESRLVKAIEYGDSHLQMPPEGKLPQDKIDAVKKWIQDGAEDPRSDEPVATPPKSTFADKLSFAKTHWSYQSLIESSTNEATAKLAPEYLSREIDRLIAIKLSDKKLSFSPLADRRTLVRRLYLDLIGLPPNFDEVEKVLADANPDWYERLLKELLDSPHFGERMARRWMDVARYADNKGYVFTEDREYPHAYRYRDWLIRSFNTDLPYDQFLKYQIIADRLDPDNSKGHLDAMGMLTLGRRFLQNPNDIADDRIDVITRGFLGTTVACARCHDHKFDPVSAADYYSLRGAFVGSDEPGGEPSPMRLIDKPNQSEVYIFLRGNEGNRGPVVEKKFFTGMLGDRSRIMSTGSGRVEIANSMVEDCKGLTARVYVNRIWTWITGQPIVDTPSDFGLRCETPVQHDVLDLLAADFVSTGWSTKQLIHTILLTRTYMQQSLHRDDAYAIDPDNRYFWRSKRRRMDFESFRDALLVSTGKLDRTIGGPSAKIHQAPFSNRRTLYAYIDRQNLPSLFRTFDFASPDSHVPQRSETTVPQQGLVLMNSDIMMNLLDGFSKSSESEPDSTEAKPHDAIGALFKKILSRQPTSTERKAIKDFCAVAVTELPGTPENCWRYGYGKINKELNRTSAFRLLPLFQDGRWMGSEGKLPDKDLGWTHLSSGGGHPGEGLDRSAIRRWVAPRAGSVYVEGKLKHAADQGDGIHGAVIIRSRKSMGNWDVRHGETETKTEPIRVKVGETIDFVVTAKSDTNSDSFEWTSQVIFKDDPQMFDSQKNFVGTRSVALDRWQQATQVLLLSNEFCFVD